VEAFEGDSLGLVEGFPDGDSLGLVEGFAEGASVGAFVGATGDGVG